MQLILLTILLSLFLFRKQIRSFLFKFTFVYFEQHQSLGEYLGIKYLDSDQWQTARSKSGLHTLRIPFQEKFIGFNLPIGDVEFIKRFKLRQRNPITPFTISLKPGRRSFMALESELISLWHYQLKECYALPIVNDEEMIQVMLNMRRSMDADTGSFPLSRILDMVFDRKGTNKIQRDSFANMTDEEKTLYLVPFLTTLDTFMISFAYKTYGDELADFFDRVPIKYLPMYENNDVALVRLKNNGQNNPGNSVFGPKGVVCPGSNVTTDILKAMMHFTQSHTWDIEGTPEQHNKSISGLKNMPDLYLTLH